MPFLLDEDRDAALDFLATVIKKKADAASKPHCRPVFELERGKTPEFINDRLGYKERKNDEKIGLMHVYRRTFLHLRLLRRSPGTAVEQPPVTGSGGFAGGPPGFRLPGLLPENCRIGGGRNLSPTGSLLKRVLLVSQARGAVMRFIAAPDQH